MKHCGQLKTIRQTLWYNASSDDVAGINANGFRSISSMGQFLFLATLETTVTIIFCLDIMCNVFSVPVLC